MAKMEIWLCIFYHSKFENDNISKGYHIGKPFVPQLRWWL